MARIDPSVVAEIKARLRIEDVIGRHVRLRRVGSRLVGPCPFHQETKPSFCVNPDDGFYYCFGCQAAGDLIEFYRAIHGLDFTDAVIALAEEAGVELRLGSQARQGSSRKRLLEMQALALRAYADALTAPVGESARQYVAQRGIDPAVLSRFALGFAPAGWDFIWSRLRKAGYSAKEAAESGLVSLKENGRGYDRFRGRLMFPIWNLSGQVIAFGGRVIGATEEGPKYLNSPETPIFTKGDTLYGLYQAREAARSRERVLLTEGYMDVLTLHQFGFSAACGVLGTALTPEQVHRLAGFVSHVELVMDGDPAGRKAACRSAEMLLAQGLACSVVVLPDGEDVDSFLRRHGGDAFEKLRAQAVDGLDYCVDWVRRHHNPAETVAWAVALLRGMKRVELQAYFVPRIAGALGLSEQELRRALFVAPAAAAARTKGRASPASQRDRELLAVAIWFPQRHGELEALGFEAALSTPRGKELWRKIAGQPADAVLPLLDAGEKAFYVETQMQARDLDTEAMWESVCTWLRRKGQQEALDQVQQALAVARQHGDLTEELRLLAVLSALKAQMM